VQQENKECLLEGIKIFEDPGVDIKGVYVLRFLQQW
jgi:hypothetical protein